MRHSHIPTVIVILAFAYQLSLHSQVKAASFTTNAPSLVIQGSTITYGTNPVIKAISSAGNFNGDAYRDMVIGLPSLGIAYIIFGSANGIPDIDVSIALSQGIKITGSAQNGFGSSVGWAGDVNKDGFDDVIVGAPMMGSAILYGSAYVIFGTVQLNPIDVSNFGTPGNSQGIKLIGISGAGFGAGVGRAGDVNGDGVDDVIVSATSNSPSSAGPFTTGSAYIIYGSSSPQLTLTVDNSLAAAAGFRIDGSISGERFGASVGSAGDVNDDGVDDILIGATSSTCSGTSTGAVFIIYGKLGGVASTIQTSSTSLTSSQGVKICGTTTSKLGVLGSISPVGDLNKDGADDIAIGDYLTSVNSLANAGSVSILYGKTGGFGTTAISLYTSPFPGVIISGNGGNSQIGAAVTVGDIDGDHILDLVLPVYTGSSSDLNSGIVHVLFGGNNGFSNFDFANPSTQILRLLQIYGPAAGAEIGMPATMTNDLNNDGAADILTLGVKGAYIFSGSRCPVLTDCTSTSLSPVCYSSKGCLCGQNYHLYFQNDDCVPSCSSQGYYAYTSICEACPSSCLTCTSASTCQSCNPGFILQGTSCQALCPLGSHLEGSICKIDVEVTSIPKDIETINSITDAMNIANEATLTTASVIAPHDPGSVTASMLAKMLQYIKFLDLPYSRRLELTFKYHNSTYGPFGLGPKIPLDVLLETPLNHNIPFRFLKFHVHSNFLINFWDNLIFISIISGVLLLLVVIEYIVAKTKDKKSPYPLIRTIRTAVQNFCLMQFYNVFGDILLFFALDLRKVTLDAAELITSFCLSILFCFVGCVVLTIHIYVLVQFSLLRKKKTWTTQINEFSKQYEGLDVLFQHFKDNLFISQSFLLIFVIRNLLFNLVLALLYEIPLVQIILIFIMSVVILIYILLQRPFKTIVNLVQHIVFELTFLIVNICVLIVAQLNFDKQDSYQIRDQTCEVIIYTSLVFSFVPQVFLAIKLGVAVYDWYNKSNTKSLQTQMKSKQGQGLKIQKRLGNQAISEYSQYPNQSLDESSVELSMIQNTSTMIMHTNGSSLIEQNGSPARQGLNNKNQQQFQGSMNTLKQMRQADHQKFRQQADSQSSHILRPGMTSNTVTTLDSIDMVQSNQPGNHWGRKRTNRNRKNL